MHEIACKKIEKINDTIFSDLGTAFHQELIENAIVKEFSSKTLLIDEGQLLEYIPIMINGLVKVYACKEEKELLHYYVEANQTCIMSFLAVLGDGFSKIYAITEEDSEVLLIPSEKIKEWIVTYPKINYFFFGEFGTRYDRVMKNIYEAVYYKLDKRILEYLAYRLEVANNLPLKISHKDIAADLGTAREVVTRLLKKLENDGYIVFTEDGYEILKQL